jgi:hypothetical protein
VQEQSSFILPASAMYPKTTGLFSLFFCYSPSLSHVSQNHRSFFSLFLLFSQPQPCIPKPQVFFLSFLLFSQPQPCIPKPQVFFSSLYSLFFIVLPASAISPPLAHNPPPPPPPLKRGRKGGGEMERVREKETTNE